MSLVADIEKGRARQPQRLPPPSTVLAGEPYKTLGYRRNSSSTFYIAGHLINNNLHGSGGLLTNLVPLTRGTDFEHSSRIEEVVKGQVFKRDQTTGTSNVVRYEVTTSNARKDSSDIQTSAKTKYKDSAYKLSRALQVTSIEDKISRTLVAKATTMVKAIDDSSGQLRTSLDANGIAENTVVIFLSDQGGHFENPPLLGGKMKETIYEGGARVTFIIHYPGVSDAAKNDSVVQSTDLFPTLLEIAGENPDTYSNLEVVPRFPIPFNKDSLNRNEPICGTEPMKTYMLLYEKATGSSSPTAMGRPSSSSTSQKTFQRNDKPRKSFSTMVAGDQHLGTVVQHGVEEWVDAGYRFFTLAIANLWMRWRYPRELGRKPRTRFPSLHGRLSRQLPQQDNRQSNGKPLH